MKTPDEIKRGLECCHITECGNCPYMTENIECREIFSDALAYIRQLEAENTRRHEKIIELYNTIESLHGCIQTIVENSKKTFRQLEAERDAVISELIGTCQVCRWEETEKCASCHFNTYAWNVHESKWEWRGLPEQPKEE